MYNIFIFSRSPAPKFSFMMFLFSILNKLLLFHCDGEQSCREYTQIRIEAKIRINK